MLVIIQIFQVGRLNLHNSTRLVALFCFANHFIKMHYEVIVLLGYINVEYHIIIPPNIFALCLMFSYTNYTKIMMLA